MTIFAGDISDFQFTQVVENNIPYKVAGYATATCGSTTAYFPPSGWNVISCTPMPDGTYGAPTPYSPVVLVFCEPDVSVIAVNDDGTANTSTSSSQLAQIGGVPGVIALGAAAVALIVGYIHLASKSSKK